MMSNLPTKDSFKLNSSHPSLVLLSEIAPQIELSVLLDILRANGFDINRSIDATLAVCATYPSLNNSPRESTNESDISQPSLTVPQASPAVKLPSDFLSCPKYRVVIDTCGCESTDFTIVFRKLKGILGIVIKNINNEIVIKHLHMDKNNRPCLAIEAGVQIGDILTGIDYEYFAPGVDIEDVVTTLSHTNNYVTLHFTRRYAGVRSHRSLNHRFVNMLMDQELLDPRDGASVTRTIFAQRRRIFKWNDFDFQKILNQIRTPEETKSTFFSLFARSANESSVQLKQNNLLRIRPALCVRVLRAEEKKDHTVYVLWVLDILSGCEWLIRRRFREFFDFRDVSS